MDGAAHVISFQFAYIACMGILRIPRHKVRDILVYITLANTIRHPALALTFIEPDIPKDSVQPAF
jgi:hypothetical protein